MVPACAPLETRANMRPHNVRAQATAPLLLVLLLVLFPSSSAQGAVNYDPSSADHVAPADAEKPGEMKVKVPNENEEESKSTALPDEYRCEACAAVAWQLQYGLRKAELRRSKGGEKRLREIELMDTITNICSPLDVHGNVEEEGEGWRGYGLKPNDKSEGGKHVPGNRKNLLNGDGLPDAAKIWA
jgi:hypothetical protein